MKKNFVDREIYDELVTSMKENGINNDIFQLAEKMDINLPRLFYEKLLVSPSKENKESLSKNLLGIYGNYFATFYFKGMNYNVSNEFPVYDEKQNLITKADLAFFDKTGVLNYCEVKATSQIIDNIRNYYDVKENGYVGGYYDIDSEIIKYKNIGKKLLKQVDKLSMPGVKVNVIVFNGCRVDNVIAEELQKRNVNIQRLAININDLEKYVDSIIDSVIKNILKKHAEKSSKRK